MSGRPRPNTIHNNESFVNKQPLKRLSIPINKFNDVAVPHHVDLLKRHKSNIEKFQEQGDWDRVHREQINATRLVKQLKSLLYEMEVLRSQVQESDITSFDKLIEAACQNARDAIQEYSDLNPMRHIMPSWNESSAKALCDGGERGPSAGEVGVERLQKEMSESVDDLEKREQCLKSWQELQTEVQDIHNLFEDFARLVQDQREAVDHIETSVETTQHNVTAGVTHLRTIKTAMYPLAGALIGGCLGGPVGLMAGMKLGGVAALGCGFIGFTGGKLLKKRKEEEIHKFDVELLNVQREKEQRLQSSTSMPNIKSD